MWYTNIACLVIHSFPSSTLNFELAFLQIVGISLLNYVQLDCKLKAVLLSLIMCLIYLIYIYFGRNGPQWARASSLMRFLDDTQRRITVGRTPLDE